MAAQLRIAAVLLRNAGRRRAPFANDYTSQITEKQETIASLNTEIVSIQKAIEEQKNTLKEKKIALKKAEKEVASMEAKISSWFQMYPLGNGTCIRSACC